MFDIKKIKSLFQNKDKQNTKGGSNPNRDAQSKQMMNGIYVITAISIIAIILFAVFHHGEKKVQPKNIVKKTVVDGVLSSDFNQQNTTSALEEQQREMDALKSNMNHKLTSMDKNFQLTVKQAIAKAKQGDKHPVPGSAKQAATYQNSQTQTTDTNTMPYGTLPNADTGDMSNNNMTLMQRGIQQFTFSSDKPVMHHVNTGLSYDPNAKNIKTYVPAGTFAKGILLEGADADASTNGQSNTAGILIRLLDNGTIANGKHSSLKGCFIVASIYGDISSERGEVRLDRLSCTKKDGTVIQKSVEGYVSFAGKQGVRGRVVSRNGKLLFSSTVAGALSGVGNALQQSLQTVTQNPLGTTTSMSPGNVGKAAAYAGGGSAMNQLAKYYIKSANNIHPVIEIPSGTQVTVIFQNGFSLVGNDDDNSNKPAQATGSGLSKTQIMKFMAHAKGFTPSGQSSSDSDQPFSSVG